MDEIRPMQRDIRTNIVISSDSLDDLGLDLIKFFRQGAGIFLDEL